MMKSEFEVHETIRQVQIAMHVFDHNTSAESRLTFYNEWKRLTGAFPLTHGVNLS